MGSIQQIVENVIYKVMEIGFKQRNDGIKGMARDVQATVKEAALEMLSIMLEQYDQMLFEDKERKQDWKPVRRNDTKTIMTCVGELKYQRRYYQHKATGEYRYLLDDRLGVTPHQQIGDDVREDLVNSAVDISYAKSGKIAAPDTVSKTSVGRYVGQTVTENAMRSDGKKRVCEELYVEADEDHVALQNGRNVQVRLVYVHEGNVSDTKRAKLGHVRYLTWPIGGDTDDMWETVATYIEEQYDTDKLQRIWLSGDGAEWIKTGSEWLPKCTLLLDKYHQNKRFMSLTAQTPYMRGHGHNVLKNGTIAQMNSVYEHAVEKADTQSKQSQLANDFRYIIRHWPQIEAGRNPGAPGCSAEGHISHVLSARLSSRPMGWSKVNLEQMAALRVMSANGIAIKYTRSASKTEPFSSLPNAAVASTRAKLHRKIASAMKNVRPPLLAAGNMTPTYTALRGLADGHAVN